MPEMFPAGTPFIEKVLPEESQEDIINALHLESLLGDIQDNIEETQLIELMDLLLDVKVSFPLIKDLSSGELENVVTFTENVKRMNMMPRLIFWQRVH